MFYWLVLLVTKINRNTIHKLLGSVQFYCSTHSGDRDLFCLCVEVKRIPKYFHYISKMLFDYMNRLLTSSTECVTIFLSNYCGNQG